jgi:nucleoside phosphorylase
MITRPRLYLHFLDAYHTHRAYQNSHSRNAIIQEARRAFRLAIVAASQCYVPASSFFESELARSVLSEHPLCVATGRVRLTSADPSLEDHREGKIRQYGSASPLNLGSAYTQRIDSSVGYKQRPGATRPHLVNRWLEQLDSGNLLTELDPIGALELPGSLERAWAAVPSILGDLAFIPGHARDALSRLTTANVIPLHWYIRNLIESSYIETYMLSLGTGLVRDLVRLGSPFPLPSHPSSISYPELLTQAARGNLLRYLDDPDETRFLQSETGIRAFLGGGEHTIVKNESADKRATRPRRRPRVAIVTILEEELTAVKAHLTSAAIRHIAGDPHVYVLGHLHRKSPKGNASLLEVIVAKQLRMTTPSAAATTILLIKAFPTVSDIMLTGIGGAIPRPAAADKDVRLGDVVVSDRAGVFHADHVTQDHTGQVYRGMLPPPSSRLLGALDRLTASCNVDEELERRMTTLCAKDPRFKRPEPDKDVLTDPGGEVVSPAGRPRPRLFRGVIASGNALVRNPEIRDHIGAISGALALEMEGAGVAEAAWSMGRQYLLVRGMSDYCDARKNDDWHWYASGVASAAAVSILECLFD